VSAMLPSKYHKTFSFNNFEKLKDGILKIDFCSYIFLVNPMGDKMDFMYAPMVSIS